MYNISNVEHTSHFILVRAFNILMPVDMINAQNIYIYAKGNIC